MTDSRIKVGIFGGSGYGGSELLRILLFHSSAEIVFVTANEHAGKAVGSVHKNLNGLTDLSFIPSPDDLSEFDDIDVLFFSPTEHNMYIDRSVILINKLDPKYIFPQHHGTIAFGEGDKYRFWAKGYPDEVKLRLSTPLQEKFHILRPGGRFLIGQ